NGGARLVLQQHPPVFDPLSISSRLQAPGPILILDATTGKEVQRVKGPALGPPPSQYELAIFTGHSARAVALNARVAANAGYDETIYLWDLETDREICRVSHPGPVHELAFSPDSRRLAAASLAAPVVVYDLHGAKAK